jgi:hypothetical protein
VIAKASMEARRVPPAAALLFANKEAWVTFFSK